MSYTPKEWTNNELPALNATNLNYIEEGIKEAHKNINKLQENTELFLNETTTYSSDEKKVGTWIDNAPIYRKVFETTLPTCATNGLVATKTLDITSLKLKQLISTNVIINGEVFQSNLPLYSGNEPTNGIRVFLLDTNTININNANSNYSDLTTYIILEYTKMTD